MNTRQIGFPLLLAISLTCAVCPAYADPAPTNNKNLITWTSSDRFALVGCLVIGLGAGLGGVAAYSGAQDTANKADEREEEIKQSTGKPHPCPTATGCQEVARLRKEANDAKPGAVAAMVIGGLMLGLVPFVIYWGFKPKEPSSPNLMMKLHPVVGPGQAGFALTGRF